MELNTHKIAKAIAAKSSFFAYDTEDSVGADGEHHFAVLSAIVSEPGGEPTVVKVHVAVEDAWRGESKARVRLSDLYRHPDREADQAAHSSYREDGAPEPYKQKFSPERIDAMAKAIDGKVPELLAITLWRTKRAEAHLAYKNSIRTSRDRLVKAFAKLDGYASKDRDDRLWFRDGDIQTYSDSTTTVTVRLSIDEAERLAELLCSLRFGSKV